MQADLERFWARLLTEPDFRTRFIADPAGFAEQHGLSPEERDAVARTQIQDLQTAARSYAAKNAGGRADRKFKTPAVLHSTGFPTARFARIQTFTSVLTSRLVPWGRAWSQLFKRMPRA